MNYCIKCGSPLVSKQIDQRQRWCCTDAQCGYIHWNNPIPVVAMVVETDGGIVLAHHKLAPAGIYSIITGFLEAGEAPEAAARRETMEELGLKAGNTHFLGLFPFAKANQLVIAYHILAHGPVHLNDELDDFKLVQKNELLGYAQTGQFEVQQWLDQLNVLA